MSVMLGKEQDHPTVKVSTISVLKKHGKEWNETFPYTRNGIYLLFMLLSVPPDRSLRNVIILWLHGTMPRDGVSV
jgi:hypothetical protein